MALKKIFSGNEILAAALQKKLEAIDIFAFKKMDERLLSYLQKRSEVLGENAFNMTHQEMALQLNTSREVVSRLLKKLEQNKQIKVTKSKIVLL